MSAVEAPQRRERGRSSRRPWPTRNTFWNLALAMVCFGLLMGVIFPFFSVALGIDSSEALRPAFFLACLGAGFLVGIVNYTLARWVVGHRLRQLSARMHAAEQELRQVAASGEWREEAAAITAPVNSQDEFGESAAAFNYLMASLDAAQREQRKLQDQLSTQAKLAALGTLTAGVAHEVKNPLNFVINFAEINQELCVDLRDLLPESETSDEIRQTMADLQDNSVVIAGHARRALEVMASMLQLGRTSPGEARDCKVNHLVEQSASLAYHGWRAKRPDRFCKVTTELDDSDPVVRGFEADLARVVINLVTNACDAAGSTSSPSGSGSAGEAQRGGIVVLRVDHDDRQVTIRVIDNGDGIAQELATHIFDPFFTTKEGTEGTGLGLSISRDVVERHGGSLSHRPGPGGSGTEFRVCLPARGAAASRPAPGSEPPARLPAGEGRKS